jgi:hypothetical protein
VLAPQSDLLVVPVICDMYHYYPCGLLKLAWSDGWLPRARRHSRIGDTDGRADVSDRYRDVGGGSPQLLGRLPADATL